MTTGDTQPKLQTKTRKKKKEKNGDNKSKRTTTPSQLHTSYQIEIDKIHLLNK